MAKLRYIAFISENPEKIADFYNRYLGTRELGRSPEGDVSITDGFFNLTFLRKRASLGEPIAEIGLHHVGVQVESVEEAKGRYLRFNPRGVIVREPDDLHHGEIRIYDPECHPVAVSEKSFGVAAADEKRFPRVRHIAYNALDPETMLRFYSEVFGFREIPTSYVRRQQGLGNRFAGDGFTNLAIHPFYSRAEGHEVRFGLNHIGFLVDRMEATMAELSAVLKIAPRPSTRPYAEFRFRDPEGNALDLSQSKGWEVDVDKWERAA
ncbi:MAG TPA: VOC family protein [candidate division Zixibacteria bacterium]|nr:VOC family protein [candidate division Zixibacteria bacterium]